MTRQYSPQRRKERRGGAERLLLVHELFSGMFMHFCAFESLWLSSFDPISSLHSSPSPKYKVQGIQTTFFCLDNRIQNSKL